MWTIQAVDFTLAAQVLHLFALSHHEESWVLFFFLLLLLDPIVPYLAVSVRRRAIERQLCDFISQGPRAQELFVTIAKGMKHI